MIRPEHGEHKRHLLPFIVPSIITFTILGSMVVYGFIQITKLNKNVLSLQSDLASTTLALTQNTHQISQKFTDLNNQTAGLSSTLTSAQQNIDAVKNQVGGVAQAVGTMSGTVGTLEKLAKVDPQLLKKYSKVYFMNDNYVPPHLTVIPPEYTFSETKQEQFLSEAYPYLKNLLDSAKANGQTLYVKSAYRSFQEQKSLKSAYSVTYGAGTANAFSADQGYSEHQLGTTLDFMTSGLGGSFTGFDKTQSYIWLQENAHRYGFVLSYPKGNSYYIYEPWHWRYVGVKLATYLHDSNLFFYNLDQRDIDTFLVNLFD